MRARVAARQTTNKHERFDHRRVLHDALRCHGPTTRVSQRMHTCGKRHASGSAVQGTSGPGVIDTQERRATASVFDVRAHASSRCDCWAWPRPRLLNHPSHRVHTPNGGRTSSVERAKGLKVEQGLRCPASSLGVAPKESRDEGSAPRKDRPVVPALGPVHTVFPRQTRPAQIALTDRLP